MGNSDHGTAYIMVGGDNGELRPRHYIDVYSIESRVPCGSRPRRQSTRGTLPPPPPAISTRAVVGAAGGSRGGASECGNLVGVEAPAVMA